MECTNGHENPNGQAFCGTCGAAIPPEPDQSAQDAPAAATTESNQAPAVPAPEPAPETAKRPTGLLIAGAVIAVALVAAIAGIALSGSDDDTVTARGMLVLFDTSPPHDITGDYDECEGTRGYADLTEGAEVTARDGDDRIIGTSNLRNLTSPSELGRYVNIAEGEPEDKPLDADTERLIEFAVGSPDVTCTFVVEMDMKRSDFYQISVGTRGEVTFSDDEFRERGWGFDLTVGD